MDQIKIGKFIAERRKNKNLTQFQLAEKLNITDRAISKWENGRSMPDSSIMLDLCKELEISVNELLSGEMIEMNNYGRKSEENLLELNEKNEHKSKMLLRSGVVIVLLVLILIVIVMYKNMVRISKDHLNSTLNNAEEIYYMTRAINDAGFEWEIQEDGSYLLVEKTDI